MTRQLLKNAWFDEERCQLGYRVLKAIRKNLINRCNRYIDEPDKSNGCSEGADALRHVHRLKQRIDG
jgi:hypothetical protein